MRQNKRDYFQDEKDGDFELISLAGAVIAVLLGVLIFRVLESLIRF